MMSSNERRRSDPPPPMVLTPIIKDAVVSSSTKDRSSSLSLPPPSPSGHRNNNPSSSITQGIVQDPRRTQSAHDLLKRMPSQTNNPASSSSPRNNGNESANTSTSTNSRTNTFFAAMGSTFFNNFGGATSPTRETAPCIPVKVRYADPGPLYVDLFSRPDGKGAYVKSFRRKPDGSMGTAEANGHVRVFDELYAINDLVVTDMLFTDIVQAAKTSAFPLDLTFHCRQEQKSGLASPAKGSIGTNWTLKFGQLMGERTGSFDRKNETGSNGSASATNSTSNSPTNPSENVSTTTPTTPGKHHRPWDTGAFDKMKHTGTDGMKNLFRMMGGKSRPEDDKDVVSSWFDHLELKPVDAGTNGDVFHSTPIEVVTTGGRSIGVRDEDASEFALTWYRKTPDGNLILIKGAKSGRYYPSVDDGGAILSLHCESLRFPNLAKVVKLSYPLILDPAVGDMVDVLLDAGAGSFSATLASNEYDSFQIKINAERVMLVKVSEQEDESGTVVSVTYNPYLQVLLDPCDQLRFTLKVQALGGFLGNRPGDTCDMKKRQNFASLSCFFLVAPNPQHRDILAHLIRKFRVKVISPDEEEQARRDELNLYVDPAFAALAPFGSPPAGGASTLLSSDEHGTNSPSGDTSTVSTTRSSFGSTPSNGDKTRTQRLVSETPTNMASGRFSDFFGLDQANEDENIQATHTLSKPPSSSFLQSRLVSKDKEVEMLQEKLEALSVLLKATDHEKAQIQAALEVKDRRIELQQAKIRQFDKLKAHSDNQASELRYMQKKLEEEERLHAECRQKLSDMVAAREAVNFEDKLIQTDEYERLSDVGSDEYYYRTSIVSIEDLQQQVQRIQAELGQAQNEKLTAIAERNSYQAKSIELAKEMKKLVGSNRSLTDVETQLADRNSLASQLAVTKAEVKRATDEMKEYKDALDCVMKQQGMGDKDKATQRILSQNLELQRVIHQLTDSLNESKEQLVATKKINSALVQKLQDLQPDARGSIFESPPISPMSACDEPTFSDSDDDDEDDHDDNDEEEQKMAGPTARAVLDVGLTSI